MNDEIKFLKLQDDSYYLSHILQMHHLLNNNYEVIRLTLARRVFREYISKNDYRTLMWLLICNGAQFPMLYSDDRFVNSSGMKDSFNAIRGNNIDSDMYNDSINDRYDDTLFDYIYKFETPDLFKKYKRNGYGYNPVLPEEKFITIRKRYLRFLQKYAPKLYEKFTDGDYDIESLSRTPLYYQKGFHLYHKPSIQEFISLFNSSFDINNFVDECTKIIDDMRKKITNLIYYKTLIAFKNVLLMKFPYMKDISDVTLYIRSTDNMEFIFPTFDFIYFLNKNKNEYLIYTLMKSFNDLFNDYKRWRLFDGAWAFYITPRNTSYEMKRSYFNRLTELSFTYNNKPYFAYHTKNGFDLITEHNTTSNIRYFCESAYNKTNYHEREIQKYFNSIKYNNDDIIINFNGNIDDFLMECRYYYPRVFNDMIEYSPIKCISLTNDDKGIIKHFNNDEIAMIDNLEYYDDLSLI